MKSFGKKIYKQLNFILGFSCIAQRHPRTSNHGALEYKSTNVKQACTALPSPPDHSQMQSRVQPCTCSPQPTISAVRASRSTAPACRSIRFTSLRFHSAPSVCAVQRKRNQVGASLRSRSLRAHMPTDDDLHCPPSPDRPSRHAR